MIISRWQFVEAGIEYLVVLNFFAGDTYIIRGYMRTGEVWCGLLGTEHPFRRILATEPGEETEREALQIAERINRDGGDLDR